MSSNKSDDESGSQSGSGSERSGSERRSGSGASGSQRSGSGGSGERSGSAQSGSGSQKSGSGERSGSGGDRSGSGGDKSGSGGDKSGSGGDRSGSGQRSGEGSGSQKSGSAEKSGSGGGESGSAAKSGSGEKSASGSRSGSGDRSGSGAKSGSGSGSGERSGSGEKSASRSEKSSGDKSSGEKSASGSGSRSGSGSEPARSSEKSGSGSEKRSGSEESEKRSSERSGSERSGSERKSSEASRKSSAEQSRSGSERSGSDKQSDRSSEKRSSDRSRSRSERSGSSGKGSDSDRKGSDSDKGSESGKESSEKEESGDEEESEAEEGSEGSEQEEFSGSEEEVEEVPPLKEWFMSLPEVDSPEFDKNQELTPAITDEYLKGLQENIAALSAHVKQIQNEESNLMLKFILKLQETDKKNDKFKEDFLDKLQKIRQNRREYRGLMFDAIQERNNILRAKELARQDEIKARKKLDDLNVTPRLDFFYFFFFALQIAIMVLLILFMDFENTPPSLAGIQGAPTRADFFNTYWVNVCIFVFVGLSLVNGNSRYHLWSTLGFSMLLAALSAEWSFITDGFFQWATDRKFHRLDFNFKQITNALYAAATVLVSYGAVVGLLSPEGLVTMAVFEVIFYSLNSWIIQGTLDVVDPGGAISIHLFGGVFGFAVGAVVGKLVKVENKAEAMAESRSSYASEIWSFVGALFIFIMFPSFNAALAPSGTQFRIICTTLFAETSAAITAFAFSHFKNSAKSYRFNMSEIRDAIVIGGITVACAHSYTMNPFGGVILGLVGVLLGILFYWFVHPRLYSMNLHDVRGVLSRHALPGLLAAVASSISLAEKSANNNVQGQLFFSLFAQKHDQALRQFFGWLITIFLSFAAGGVTGLIITILSRRKLIQVPRRFFVEDHYWAGLPNDYDA